MKDLFTGRIILNSTETIPTIPKVVALPARYLRILHTQPRLLNLPHPLLEDLPQLVLQLVLKCLLNLPHPLLEDLPQLVLQLVLKCLLNLPRPLLEDLPQLVLQLVLKCLPQFHLLLLSHLMRRLLAQKSVRIILQLWNLNLCVAPLVIVNLLTTIDRLPEF